MATQEDADSTLASIDIELFKTFPGLIKLGVVQRGGSKDLPSDFCIEAGFVQSEEVPVKFLTSIPIIDLKGVIQAETIEIVIVKTGRARFGALHEVGGKEHTLEDGSARARPAKGGHSIGNNRFDTYGTLGSAILRPSDGAAVYFLSCAHVLKKNTGQNGDMIIQPGKTDGAGGSTDKIGVLQDSILNQYFDAALCKADANKVAKGFRAVIGDAAYSKTPIAPTLNEQATIVGRTSDSAAGRIRSINMSVTIDGNVFRNQIETEGVGVDGDSGSILFQKDGANFKPIGLFFGGVFDGTNLFSYSNPLKKLFDEWSTLNSAQLL